MTKRAVFLDRDGTLIIDHGYIHETSQVELLPGVLEALVTLQKLGFELIIISNQSGIGRGLITQEEVDQINQYLHRLLNMHEITLTDFYYCPHSPDEECLCRKPKPGLIIKALQEHQLAKEHCYFVGDKWTDVQAAIAAGVKPVLLSQENQFPINNVLTVDSLLTWTKLIKPEDI